MSETKEEKSILELIKILIEQEKEKSDYFLNTLKENSEK